MGKQSAVRYHGIACGPGYLGLRFAPAACPAYPIPLRLNPFLPNALINKMVCYKALAPNGAFGHIIITQAKTTLHPPAQKLAESLLILISYGDVDLAYLQRVAGDRVDLIQRYNVGAVYAHKTFGGQLFFQCF